MSLGWIVPVLLGWSVLVLPGLLVLRAAGSRLPVMWGAGPPLTVLLVVIAGAVDAALGVPWTARTAVIELVLVLAAVLVARALLTRRPRRTGRGTVTATGTERGAARASRRLPRAGYAVPIVLAIAVGFAVAGVAERGMGSLDTLNGSYDAYFHIAALEFIRADRSALLTTALEGIYGEPTFYPAGWDVLAALLPWDPVISANAMALAMLVALPASLATMVSLLLGPRDEQTERRLLTAVAAACAPMFLSLPVIILVMGLWPFALGGLCLPVALGALWRLGTLVLPRERSRPMERLRRPGPLLAPLAITAGALLAHPANVFSAGLAVLAVVTARALMLLRRPRARRRGIVVLGLLALLLGTYGVASQLLLASMDLTVTTHWPWPAHLISVLIDRPRLSVLPVQAWAVLILWVMALIGGVHAVRRGGLLGVSALVLGTAVVFLSALTNLATPLARVWVYPWYGARERFAPLLMCALVTLGALGVQALRDRRRASRTPVGAERADRGARRRAWALPTALVLIAVSSLSAIFAPQRFGLIGSLAYTAYGVQLEPYVTPRERAFIERSAAELPRDAVVIGNPRDGEAAYWSLGGVTTVFPTMSEPQTLDSRRVARYVYQAGYNPDVCRSLQKVGPTHLYVDESADSGARIAPQAAILYSGLERIPRENLHLVDRDGPYALYRIDPLC